MKYKVYLAKLKRTDAWPRCVYKVGITSSTDAMRRLTYTGPDEPNPIVGTFPDIKVMKAIWCESREEAEQVEAYIMKTIREAKGDAYFHNWREPKKLSGITEMRKWDYDEIQAIFKLMDEVKTWKTIMML